jgi:hypothetical protein
MSIEYQVFAMKEDEVVRDIPLSVESRLVTVG